MKPGIVETSDHIRSLASASASASASSRIAIENRTTIIDLPPLQTPVALIVGEGAGVSWRIASPVGLGTQLLRGPSPLDGADRAEKEDGDGHRRKLGPRDRAASPVARRGGTARRGAARRRDPRR